MKRWYRLYLARAAARERDARADAYPDMVAAGEIERGDAEADLAAWRVIAALFASPSVETSLGWPELLHAASRALLRREEALAASPGDPDLQQRRDTVWAIHRQLSFSHAFHSRPLERFDPHAAAARERQAA